MAMITPHLDRHIAWDPSVSIPGWRKHWLERLIQNAPKHKIARRGYLSALYQLRAETMPGAYSRDHATADFQECIDRAIRELTHTLQQTESVFA